MGNVLELRWIDCRKNWRTGRTSCLLKKLKPRPPPLSFTKSQLTYRQASEQFCFSNDWMNWHYYHKRVIIANYQLQLFTLALNLEFICLFSPLRIFASETIWDWSIFYIYFFRMQVEFRWVTCFCFPCLNPWFVFDFEFVHRVIRKHLRMLRGTLVNLKPSSVVLGKLQSVYIVVLPPWWRESTSTKS